MARADLLHQLAYRNMDPNKFNFDLIQGPPVLSLLSPYDVQLIDDISRDPKLVTKLDQRLKLNDQIMRSRGFIRMTQGTNRAVYKHLEDQSFVFKIAISDPGRKDSPAEYYNQHKLRPFVSKCFDVVPSGVIGSFERVEDITSKAQFQSIAGEVFDMINKVVGKYVMADIGTNFFRNYGIRLGFGPVWLDYPMLYEVEESSLFCNNLQYGIPCGGAIDYDAGFNFLFCEKCGKQYTASSLAKAIKEHTVQVITKRRKRKMKIEVFEGNKKVGEKNLNVQSSDTYVRSKRNEKLRERAKKEKEMRVKDEDEVVEEVVMNSSEPEKEDTDEGRSEYDNIETGSEDTENDNEELDIPDSSDLTDEAEIDQASDADEYSPEVYEEGRETKDRGISEEMPESSIGTGESEEGNEELDSDGSRSEEESEGGSRIDDESDSDEDDEYELYKESLTPEDFIQDLENIKEFCNNLEKAFVKDQSLNNSDLDYHQQYFVLKAIVDNLWNKYEIIKDKPMPATSMQTEAIDLDGADPRDIHSPEELAQMMNNY